MEQKESYVTMDCVKIDKTRLMTKIKENRNLHEIAYAEAVEAYKVVIINKFQEAKDAEIKRHNERMKELEDEVQAFKLDSSIRLRHVIEVKPVSHIEDYDTAIAMLDFSLDDVVELDRQEFQSYVMDNWAWKKDFINTNNTMIAGSAFYNAVK